MSDKKTLLKENTIRRFMKLASIGPLAENFIDNKYEDPIEEKEEEVVEGSYGAALRDPVEEELPGPPMEEPGEEPEGLEPGMEEPGMEGGEEDVEATVTVPETDVEALRTARDVLDQVLSAAEGEEGMEEPGMEEPGMEEPGMEGPPPGEEETEMVQEDEADEEGIYEYKEEDLVKEVSRRVAKRLKQRSHKEKIAEELAERIFHRLKKKG